MRLFAPACGALLVLAALTTSTAPARAAGLNLSWNDCGAAGAAAQSFACNSDAGSHTLVATAVTGHDLTRFCGEYSELELTVDQGSLSAWWQMDDPAISGVRGCRFGSAVVNFDFSGMGSCQSAWASSAFGGVNFKSGIGGANKAFIRTVAAIAGDSPLSGSDELAFFKLVVNHAGTTGASACGGCGDGAAIVFRKLQVAQVAGYGDYDIADAPLQRNYVLWQGGTTALVGGPGVTPTLSTTWGAVKSLYRR